MLCARPFRREAHHIHARAFSGKLALSKSLIPEAQSVFPLEMRTLRPQAVEKRSVKAVAFDRGRKGRNDRTHRERGSRFQAAKACATTSTRRLRCLIQSPSRLVLLAWQRGSCRS